MREIKFRAWDTSRNVMLPHEALEMHNISDLKDAKIWMQYTGLKDRLDKEIYEGDILGTYVTNNFGSRERRIGVMEFKPEWAQFALRLATDVPDNFDDDNPATPPEVIGNIYENPELLEHAPKH